MQLVIAMHRKKCCRRLVLQGHPSCPAFKHPAAKKCLWIDGFLFPAWVAQARIPQAQDEDDDILTFVALLQACAKNKDLCGGTRVHDDIVRRGLLLQCSDALVTMYAKCGALAKAKELFDMRKSTDVFTWNALIAGYAQKGYGQDALDYFEQLKCEGLVPDAVTYVCALKACGIIGAAEKGEQIHDQIAKRGLLATNTVLGNALVSMYAKCGALTKARQVLEELLVRNVAAWNALIAGYVQHGEGEQALTCLDWMQQDGLSPNAVTFTSILKACGSIGAVDKGGEIHDDISRQGLLGNDVILGTALVDMYAKCGALSKAQQVLEELPVRNVTSWNALLTGLTQQGEGNRALNCFEQMQSEGLCPNLVTFVCILKACGMTRTVVKGEQIHDMIAKQGMLGDDIELGTALVDMYAKCGALSKARQVLKELSVRNVISWSALIAGYAQEGEGEQALECFEHMQREGLCPNAVTFLCILKACGSIRAIEKGEKIHDEISKRGLLRDNLVLGTALVDMYAKCGALRKAQQVLEALPVQDAIPWNALISGYAHNSEGEQALTCFEQMQREGLSPDVVTFICLLTACAGLGRADKGEQIHDEISKQGLLGSDIVLGTALVDMYAKCGALAKAWQVLEELPIRNAISWNALISGSVYHGEGEQALKCFEQMQREGLCPDCVTFICILKACSSMGAADKGEKVHDEMAKQGLLGNDIVLGTALVDMYAKCGAFTKARRVLKELPVQNVIPWNALIAGSVQQGEGEQALISFEQLECEGLSPDAATFSCVLSACSRLGLVENAQDFFVNMSTRYGLKPDLKHYTCMVDLFGRAGHLDKAVQVIEKLPSSDNAVWSALLGACQKWGDVIVGKWAFERAVQADKSDAALYVLMANIYAAAGMPEDAANIEAMSIRNEAWKKQGQSWMCGTDFLHLDLHKTSAPL